MMPSMMQDIGDLFDALDSADFSRSSSAPVPQTDSDDDAFDSFSFDAPKDQFLPGNFQVSSPRFIQLPSLGGLLSGLRSVAPPQLPRPISSPMRLLSNLNFASPQQSSGFQMSSVQLEHRDGKTIRTETTYGPDGSEHTTRSVTEDQQQDAPNDFDLNDMMEAFGPRQTQNNDDSDEDMTADLGDILKLFDIDVDAGSSNNNEMPCDMHGSNTQRLSGPADSDDEDAQPAGAVQVMFFGDLSEQDMQDIAKQMGLEDMNLEQQKPQEPQEEPEEKPVRSEPISEQEAEEAVKSSLAAINTKDVASSSIEKELSQRIAEALKIDSDDVSVTKQGGIETEEDDEEEGQAADAAPATEDELKSGPVTPSWLPDADGDKPEDDKQPEEDKDEKSGADADDEDKGDDDEEDEDDAEDADADEQQGGAAEDQDADADEDAEDDEEDDKQADDKKDVEADDTEEEKKLQKEVAEEEDMMHEVKERVRNTKLALKDEADEKKYELLEAKDDEERAAEAAAKAKKEEAAKEADVTLLAQLNDHLQKLGANVH